MPIVITPPRVCDVCRLLDGDVTLKQCGFCGLCSAWICASDRKNLTRRGLAMLKRKLELTA